MGLEVSVSQSVQSLQACNPRLRVPATGYSAIKTIFFYLWHVTPKKKTDERFLAEDILNVNAGRGQKNSAINANLAFPFRPVGRASSADFRSVVASASAIASANENLLLYEPRRRRETRRASRAATSKLKWKVLHYFAPPRSPKVTKFGRRKSWRAAKRFRDQRQRAKSVHPTNDCNNETGKNCERRIKSKRIMQSRQWNAKRTYTPGGVPNTAGSNYEMTSCWRLCAWVRQK